MKQFDRDIQRLEEFLDLSATQGEITTSCSYQLRFDALYCRARLMILEEDLKMVDALKALENPYQHTMTLIEGIQQIVVFEAKQHIAKLQSMIIECEGNQLKRLECEVRLTQMHFHLLLRPAGISNDSGVETSLHKIRSLIRTYPDTAGQYLDIYRNTKAIVDGRQPNGNVDEALTRRLWWSWPKHKIGHLKHCTHGHPYSGKTWTECPECGREITKSKMEKVCLKEIEFVVAMRDHHFNTKAWQR